MYYFLVYCIKHNISAKSYLTKCEDNLVIVRNGELYEEGLCPNEDGEMEYSHMPVVFADIDAVFSEIGSWDISEMRNISIMTEEEYIIQTYGQSVWDLWRGKNNLIDRDGNPYDEDTSLPVGGGLDKRCDYNADALYAYYTLKNDEKIFNYLEEKGFELYRFCGDFDYFEWVKGNTRIVFESYDKKAGQYGYMHTEFIVA